MAVQMFLPLARAQWWTVSPRKVGVCLSASIQTTMPIPLRVSAPCPSPSHRGC